MNPLINQVRDELRGSWRFRWLALAAAAGIALVGWLVIFSLEDMYEAGASVFVDTRTALRPVLQGVAVEQDVDAELNFVRQSLLASPSLRRVALAGGLLTASSDDKQQQQLLTKMRQRVEITVRSANDREEDRNTAGSIYHIAYQDHERARSLRIVEILLNTLVNETLGGKREGAENAQQFLQSQLADYEKRLRTAEDALAEFKSRHIGVMPTEQGGYFAELQKESEAAATTKTKMAEAESRKATLMRQLHGDVAVTATGGGTPSSGGGSKGSLDTLSRIDDAQAHLDELLLRFTDAHPDVIAARQTLEDLKRRRATEIESLRKGDPDAAATSRASNNPVYQSVQLALNQVEVDIADLNTELAQHESKVAELRRYVNTAPQVEAQLAQLNRDYDMNKAQYAALLNNLQKARLGERADTAGSVRFDVVQPPSAAFGPAWPRRKLFMSLILLAALAAGAGLAYGLNYLYPVISSSAALKAVGVPVLGQVSAAFPQRERRTFRRDVVWISMATACLVVAFGVAVILSQAGYRVILTGSKLW